MSTFEYLTPGEAVDAAQSDAPDYKRITGLMGADADWCIRTARLGRAIKPEDTWNARTHLDKFKEIARVEWAKDADPGTIEVFYADGTTGILHSVDLLCVERPITTTIPTDEPPQPVIVSVVRGESPTARAVEPGLVLTIPDEWITWAGGHGLDPDDTDVYLIVTPEDEAGEVAGEIASRKFWIPAEDVAAIRQALDPAKDDETIQH